MRAARPSPRAAANAASMRAAPVSVVTPSAIERCELVGHLVHVLVAPAGEGQDVEAVAIFMDLGEEPGDRVRGLERGDDALETGQFAEGAESFRVGDRDVCGATGIPQVRVLRSDPGIVQAGRDRVRFEDLALIVFEHCGEGAVQHTLSSGDQRGAVPTGLEALPAGLDSDQLDRVIEEGVEAADRVGAAANAGDHPLGQRALGLERLGAGLRADHALKVPHERRVRSRSDDRADHVMRVLDRGDPVPNRGADRLLQRSGTGFDRDHLGAEQLHPLHVRCLPADVLDPHVHGALQAEQGAGAGGRDPVLSGAGLGDHPRLPHPASQQGLADCVVDLVGAGVGEVLALQIDAPPDALREPLRQIQRRRATDKVAQENGELGLEALVLPRLRPRRAELVQRRDERLGHEAPSIGAEALLHQHQRGTSSASLPGMPGERASRVATPDRTASRNASTLAWSLCPGSASTPLTTSTANGLASSTAPATFSAVRPPARIIGTFERRFATRSQSKLLPVPPWIPCQSAWKRWKSVRNASAALTSAALVTRIALITVAPVRRPASRQNDGPSSPWNWSRVRFSRSAASITSSSLELTNTPAISQRRFSTAPISSATSGRTWRGLSGWWISPIAQAPWSAACSASARLVMPHTLTLAMRQG